MNLNSTFILLLLIGTSCQHKNEEYSTFQYQFDSAIRKGATNLQDSSGKYIFVSYSESCESCRQKVINLFSKEVNLCLVVTDRSKPVIDSIFIKEPKLNDKNCIVTDSGQFSRSGLVSAFPIFLRLDKGVIKDYALLDMTNFDDVIKGLN